MVTDDRHAPIYRAVNGRPMMDDKLLDDVGAGGPGTGRGSGGSGSYQYHQPRSSAAGRPATSGGGWTEKSDGSDDDWPWTKRLRLQHHRSFGSVDEDRSTTKSTDTGR